MMAPYAIAHMKIGLKLTELGYNFASEARAQIYLTNALEKADDRQAKLVGFDALAHEAEAVNKIKKRRDLRSSLATRRMRIIRRTCLPKRGESLTSIETFAASQSARGTSSSLNGTSKTTSLSSSQSPKTSLMCLA
jgi:hypothetical protein